MTSRATSRQRMASTCRWPECRCSSIDIGCLVTWEPDAPVRQDAALVVSEGRVAWVGDSSSAPAADNRLDAAGGTVLPGFVDAHTHLVFGGDRAAEFEARLTGQPYTAGGIRYDRRRDPGDQHGGIARPDTSARDRSLAVGDDDAGNQVRLRASRASRSGAASRWPGKSRRIARSWARTSCRKAPRLRRTSTRSAARCSRPSPTSPPESTRSARTALSTPISAGRCWPRVRPAECACTCTPISCGRESGVCVAAELGAASADHCTHVSERDVTALRDAGVVAVLVPAAEFSTRSPYAPARRLLDAGVTVALATDCNPGTSYTTSMPFVIALACRELAHVTARGGARGDPGRCPGVAKSAGVGSSRRRRAAVTLWCWMRRRTSTWLIGRAWIWCAPSYARERWCPVVEDPGWPRASDWLAGNLEPGTRRLPACAWWVCRCPRRRSPSRCARDAGGDPCRAAALSDVRRGLGRRPRRPRRLDHGDLDVAALSGEAAIAAVREGLSACRPRTWSCCSAATTPSRGRRCGRCCRRSAGAGW